MLQDLRYAARLIRRSPGFSAAVVLTLSLGIGATTAILSVVDAVLVRPVPFPDAERLVMVWETDRDTGTSHEPGSWPDFVDFAERSRHIDRFAGLIAGETTISPDRGEPLRTAGLFVTDQVLPMLGVGPVLGRAITAEDTRLGAPLVTLISERLWERLFQRDPAVIGRTLRLDERPRTVIGIVPSSADFGMVQVLSAADYSRGFADRDARGRVDVWLPLQANPNQLVRSTHPLIMFGRLAPAATPAAAQEELGRIAADLERAYPENKARGVFIEPMTSVLFARSGPALLVLVAAVGVLLLTACVNVANLLLVRGTRRQREVAVRSALGAGTPRLVRQFVAENLLITAGAGVLGVFAAAAALRVLVALAPPQIPRLASAAVDVRVLAMTAMLSLAVGIVFGLLPVRQARRRDLHVGLSLDEQRGASAGRAGHLTRSMLVVAQLAMAVVLATSAVLLIRSFFELRSVDAGFDASGVLKVEFQLPAGRYSTSSDKWPVFPAVQRFYDDLSARVRALPGVEHVAVAGAHPLSAGFTNSFVIVGREIESRDFPEISVRGVTPDYFSALRVRLLRGRLLAATDGPETMPVIVINETTATRFFPTRDPVGQQIAFWGIRWTVVGVVADERFHGLSRPAPIAAYTSLAQAPARGGQSLLVRTAGDPRQLAAAVRSTFTALDPALAVFGVEALTDTVAESIGSQRFVTVLLAIFAALSLTLSAIGVHGVLSYAVAQRTREIGVRIALGASPQSVTRLVMRQGVRLTIGGLAVGLALGALAARSLTSLLFGVPPHDPLTLASVVASLALVAAVAIWLPVRRALRITPIEAMRQG
jgi:putative ABC transport system permease protein